MSIQRRLLLSLLSGLIGFYVAASLAMYFSARMFLQREFDAALAAKALTLAGLVRSMPDGRLALEPLEASPAWSSAAGPDVYQVWAEDGTVLLRSAALGRDDLPCGQATETPRFFDAALPGRVSGRIAAFRMSPTVEDEDERGAAAAKTKSTPVKNVVVAVAQDRRELDHFLAILLWMSLLTSAIASAGTALVVQVVVRRGLRPLQQLAARAARIDEQSLHLRFPVECLPLELQPICLRLNASLERLQQAFQRERRFTADVAHELRTPIAELRLLAEVALSGSDAGASADNLCDTRDIALQMERIVSTLLSLARCQAGTMTAVCERVEVFAAVRDAWRACRRTAEARAVTARLEVPPRIEAFTDRTLLQSILGNLLGNAAEYCRSGGTVICTAEVRSARLEIRIVNPVDGLAASDIDHFFEPFWRKDASRTDASHSGLGLALVRAYAEILGGAAAASLSDGDSLCVAVDMPIGSSA
jgi:signal transduction histidine kinase